MRCLSCNRILSDREATRKYQSSGTFLDLCDQCYEPIKEEVKVTEKEQEFVEKKREEEQDLDKLAEKFLRRYEYERKDFT